MQMHGRYVTRLPEQWPYFGIRKMEFISCGALLPYYVV